MPRRLGMEAGIHLAAEQLLVGVTDFSTRVLLVSAFTITFTHCQWTSANFNVVVNVGEKCSVTTATIGCVYTDDDLFTLALFHLHAQLSSTKNVSVCACAQRHTHTHGSLCESPLQLEGRGSAQPAGSAVAGSTAGGIHRFRPAFSFCCQYWKC